MNSTKEGRKENYLLLLVTNSGLLPANSELIRENEVKERCWQSALFLLAMPELAILKLSPNTQSLAQTSPKLAWYQQNLSIWIAPKMKMTEGCL